MERNNIVSLVISSLVIIACFYLYSQIKTVEQNMSLSISNNEKIALQVKELLEREKTKENEFTVTKNVAELDSFSTINNTKTTENNRKMIKIGSDLVKQQQEIKKINEKLATIVKQLSEKSSALPISTEGVSAPVAAQPRISIAEQQQQTERRHNKRDTYYENYLHAGTQDAARSSEVLDKLQTTFENNSGVVLNDAECTDNGCKISLDYSLGSRSPILDIRNKFLGKNLYFSESKGANGQRQLTVYVTE